VTCLFAVGFDILQDIPWFKPKKACHLTSQRYRRSDITVAVNSPTLNTRESMSKEGDGGRFVALLVVVEEVAVVDVLPDRRLLC